MSSAARTGTAHLRRLAVLASVVVLVATPLACGSDEVRSDGDAPPTTLSLEGWTAAMDRACVELDERFDQLEDAELSTVEDAAEHAAAVERYASRLESAASRLAERSIDRSPVAEVRSSAAELSVAADDLARATRDRDPDAAAVAVVAVEAAGDTINELAEELSLDGCDGF